MIQITPRVKAAAQHSGIEHALSAYYDITHGEGLAIITPRWMKHILNEKTIDRFVKYGINVFGIDDVLYSTNLYLYI